MRSFPKAFAFLAVLAVASPAWAIRPTVSRPPTYWSCQDNLNSRITVTFLDTAPPTAILARGSAARDRNAAKERRGQQVHGVGWDPVLDQWEVGAGGVAGRYVVQLRIAGLTLPWR